MKFLHQEMGFDVLAFESGLYDCHRAWQSFQDGTDPLDAARQGVFGIWTQSAQTRNLWEYLSSYSNSAKPLELAGFDCQFTGSASREHLIDDLDDLASKLCMPTENDDWIAFRRLVQDAVDGKSESKIVNRSVVTIDLLLEKLDQPTDRLSDYQRMFWRQLIRSTSEYLSRPKPTNGSSIGEQINLRDELMAKNLLWLSEKAYPKRKIIVWAASFHIARNVNALNPLSQEINYADTMPMGQHVFESLKEKAYSIGFTAYEGNFGTWFGHPAPIEPAPSGTLERLCYESDLTNALIPFRGTNSAPFATTPMWSRPLGYAWMNARWQNHFDAMLFNRTMTPSAKRP